MNIFKFTVALRAIGFSFSVIGKLLKALGKTLSDPNLGSEEYPIERGSQRPVTGSPNTQGEGNEKPEQSEQGDFFAEEDSRESTRRE